MKSETKVNVKLSISDATKLGISKAIDGPGEIVSKYQNGIDGYYVKVDGRTLAIASKYNAITAL